MARVHSDRLELILRGIDQAFDHKAWHGTNLKGTLRGVDAAAAAWRPQPERHNIWELTLHAAYWKYTVQRRLAGLKRGSFGLVGSNWFERPTAELHSEADWRRERTLLYETHRTMRARVAELSDAALDQPPPAGSGTSNVDLLLGIAAHDLYHAGQIQLLKRLYRDRNKERQEA